MGIFSKKFGKNYPELDKDSPVADLVEEITPPLKSLMDQVKDPMEVVPAQERSYVFIGKPPKRFGVAWIEQGEVKNFQLLAKESGVGAGDMQKASEKLRTAYENNQDVERFTTQVAGRDIVVTPSSSLKQEVQQIVGEVLN